MSKDLKATSFIDLLPSSIAEDDTIRAAALALDEELQFANDGISLVFIYSRIDEIEEPLLSILAHQMHVDYWDPDLSLETKRDLVKGSIPWHRIKGTPMAVETMVKTVIGGGEVLEWFEYGGDPYFFRISTTHSLGGPDTFTKKLLPAINMAKNTRSWLEKIIVNRKTTETLNFNFAVISKKTMGLGPAFWIKPVENRFIGVVPRIGTKTTINAI
ncbi:MAG: phage tail protein I [Desulfobacterium sp.]|nr:phage tail protein I [Desulfobacterium sp.]